MNLYDLVYLIMSENQDSNIRIYQRKKDYWKEKDIKVVKYRNYGNTITGEDGTRFYWSFYQLNNQQVICLQYTDYKDDNLNPDMNFYNEKVYSFKYNFWEYWEKSNEENKKIYKKLKKIEDEETKMLIWKERSVPLYEDEVKCVKDFFYKHVVKEKKKKTETINV
tara:strand:+ start:334 stop:828 length:495 start_codon:yes stop_codon:yes gene_type:complete